MKARSTRLPKTGLRLRGLTLQLFLFTVLPLTILLLIIAFGSLSLHHDSMRALVGDRDLRAVRAAANSISHEVDHRATALQLFARQIGIPPEPATQLDASALPGFEGGLALVSASGEVLSSSIEGIDDLSSRLPPPADRATFSDPVQDHQGQWWVLSVAPTPSGDRLVGAFSPAVLARTSLAGIATPQSTILLLSPSGDVLYQLGDFEHDMHPTHHPGVPEVLRGESGVNYTGGHSDSPWPFHLPGTEEEHLVAFTPVEPLGWGLVLEESWAEIATPLLSLTQFAPLVLVPVLLLAVIALWFGARQIIRPLQALESRAAQLASGDFPAIRKPVGGISEIRHLQETLVEMAGDLQSAQESLHGYIGALTAGVENERRSLARELHDDTLQALIALNQHVQLALLRTNDPQQRQPLLDLQERVRQTITNLRRAIGGLRPIYLEDLGLTAALGMLVKEINAAEQAGTQQAQASLVIEGTEQRLQAETELAFYRIAQEALNNAVNHAQARQIQVTLRFPSSPPEHPAEDNAPDGAVTLSIQDNGKGFAVPNDPAAFARHGHYGLLGLRERAELVGADMQIETEPGQGTTIIVRCKPSPDE